MARIAVFCGSSVGAPGHMELARDAGAAIARAGLGLVYGGASVGLMGAVADGALTAGGEVIGVLPDALFAREIGHSRLTKLIAVSSMHERKAKMVDLADAFLALPGGFGTLDETFEVLTWAQLGIHEKPCAFLDHDGYYRSLLAFVDHATASGYVKPEQRALCRTYTTIAEAIAGLTSAKGFGERAFAGDLVLRESPRCRGDRPDHPRRHRSHRPGARPRGDVDNPATLRTKAAAFRHGTRAALAGLAGARAWALTGPITLAGLRRVGLRTSPTRGRSQ